MHLLIDLQGAQTSGSRHRGIGRYTVALAQAMVQQAVSVHRISLLLSDRFPETVAPLRAIFLPWVAPADIHVLSLPEGCRDDAPHKRGRVQVAEALREAFIDALRPDAVHIASLFEGQGDDAVASVPPPRAYAAGPVTAVTLYDLIPYHYPERYLASRPVRAWYERCLQHARNADLLLAISESSRGEALEVLERDPDSVVNIAAAVGEHFRPRQYTQREAAALLERYQLRPAYVLYTGGIDFRKNIERLIDAYARLSRALREQYQLVVVCSIAEPDRVRLGKRVTDLGLPADAVRFTGFVPEDDLVALYNLAALFIFPSLHEGFGLPALEAMACGAPSIGASTSSVPEVIGWDAALFDPHSTEAMTEALRAALEDPAFREQLRAHGLRQAARFSWQASARRALEALEAALPRGGSAPAPARSVGAPDTAARPRLAYLSPLPPQRSGIADYSAALLPELARYYDIDLIADDTGLARRYPGLKVRDSAAFLACAGDYDRVLYQMGNSHYHQHMLQLLEQVPGIVVLHDFYLSGLLHYCEVVAGDREAFSNALRCSHGYGGLRTLAEHGAEAAQIAFPANRPFLDEALGILVNSRYACDLARRFYGEDYSARFVQLPFLNYAPSPRDRGAARETLGIAGEEFVVCSFGHLAAAKLSRELLQAWEAAFSGVARVRLVLVGALPGDDYLQALEPLLDAAPNVTATGFVDADSYANWLAAADVGVQLRTRSRGETSGAIYDCLANGLALVFNAHGSAAELPDRVGLKLADPLEIPALVAALQRLYREPALREELGAAGRAYLKEHHAPEQVARAYAKHIETTYRSAPLQRELRLVRRCARLIAADAHGDWDDTAQRAVASAIARNRRYPRPPVLWLDLGAAAEAPAADCARALWAVLPLPWQLVCVGRRSDGWYTAHTRVAPWLGLPEGLVEEAVEPAHHDSWLRLELRLDTSTVPAAPGPGATPGPALEPWHSTPALYVARAAVLSFPADSGGAQFMQPRQSEIVAWATGAEPAPSCLQPWPL